jgi:proline dehydrogenase
MIWCYNIPAIRVLISKGKTQNSSKTYGSSNTGTITVITENSAVLGKILSPMSSKLPLSPRNGSHQMGMARSSDNSAMFATHQ